jgi:hypothetical protein
MVSWSREEHRNGVSVYSWPWCQCLHLGIEMESGSREEPRDRVRV